MVEQNKSNTTVVQREMTEIEESAPTMDSSETFVVNEEQAKRIVAEAGRKARELSAMIYLLSNLCIRDKKARKNVSSNSLISNSLYLMKQLIQ